MKLVFSKANQNLIDECGEETFFTGQDGNKYNFQLEFEDEGDGNGHLRITDTIGRIMPFDFEDLGALINILTRVKAYSNDQAHFNAFWQSEFNRG